jgi:hypothetical protein
MARPGLNHIVFGVVLLAAGVGVTLYSDVVYWWGAIVVGIIEIIRGIVVMSRGRS